MATQQEKAWLGVDPGATGALALIGDQGTVFVLDWPGDEQALAHKLWEIQLDYDVQEVVLEYQQAFPQQGVSSTFKTGMNYGMWLGAMAILRWPVRIVRPTAWKKGMCYPSSKGTAGKKATKEYSLTLARRAFPQLSEDLKRKKDHNRAEALLLARIARSG